MKNKTDITIILDRSSSMNEVLDETIKGFNSFLDKQRESSESAVVSLYQFSTDFEPVYETMPLAHARNLSRTTFIPNGWTALLDAVGTTINRVGERLARLPEASRPEQVLIVIITDGEENKSRRFNKKQIEDMVKHQTDKYSWQFLYVGANLEAIDAGEAYTSIGSKLDGFTLTSGGIHTSKPAQMLNAFDVVGRSVKNYRGSNVKNSADLIADFNDDAPKQ